MKNKIAAILILALLALVAPRAAFADVVFYEGFNYPNGNITNNSPNVCWTNFSGSANHDMYVNNHVLEVSGSSSVVPSAVRQDDDFRFFATNSGSIYTNVPQIIYASFTAIATNLPNGAGAYFAAFYNQKNGYYGHLFCQTNGTVLPNTYRIGVTFASSSTVTHIFPVDLALNTPYQIVSQYDPVNLGAVGVWINPIDASDPETLSSDTGPSGSSTINPVNGFAFRQASSAGSYFFQITNLCVATTFAEAATNVWATNALPPVIAYQPVSLQTNFIGAAFSTISAVANGQGLGSLTYNWYKNGLPYSNPDGNTNILHIYNPVVTDSGNYTLAVTTPYGLSVTSSISSLLITNAPIPPTIVSQPASNNVYSGQTVVFSVGVTGPGSITYQWRSNSVNIFGETGSTLTLTSVNSNYNGSVFSVGVTNQYGGVLSSNALLTVKVPASVTIAYLRSLVDPSTYLPTNTPATIPYTITGIVTTYTNITSGNTSSYFLQDGTAGINIFVTGGQTFRPALGDVVTFTGVVSYFGGLELDADTTVGSSLPYTSYTDLSNNIAALPAPIIIPYTITNNLSYVNYTIGESLVEITNVFFGASAGTTISTSANQAVTVTNGSGQKFALEFYSFDLDTAGQTLPAYASSVKGVLYGNTTNMFLAVTKFSDIAQVYPAIPLTLATAGGSSTLSWTDASYFLEYSTNVSGPYVPVPGATSPYTILTTNSAEFFILSH